MATQYFLDKYNKGLSEIPAPGGNGCHNALLGVANYGAMAGLSPEQIHSDLCRSIPAGRRKVTDREIQAAIDRAFSDHRQSIILPNGKSYRRYTPPKDKPIIHNGKITLQNIIKKGIISQEADLCDLSPIRLLEPLEYDPILFLNTLYDPDDYIWMGMHDEPGIIDRNIRTVSDWIRLIRLTGKTSPFFIINPLSGKPVPKMAGGGDTYRSDRNVQMFKYALVEFDNLSHEDQIRFWSAVKLPIRSLVDTGGKSIHALLDVPMLAKVETYDQWKTQIKQILYEQYLMPLSVDAACSNPARLSRMPGHYRNEKNNWQRLIWLSPVGRSIKNA